jgi:hypothetical protein
MMAGPRQIIGREKKLPAGLDAFLPLGLLLIEV